MFSKVPESVIACGRAVVIDPKVSRAIDYEAELAVIIGKAGRGIEANNALDHVWGYTIINDVTARDLQARLANGSSANRKTPSAPWAPSRSPETTSTSATRRSVAPSTASCGRARTRILLIFGIPKIIETLSAGITLQPGDVIATGTPAGVGIGFDPPKYLKGGDVVRIEIGGIGVLENEIVERSLMTSIRLGGMTVDSEGEGPPIVMLHGLGGTSNSFQAMVPPLAGFRIVRPDLPGAGRSPPPPNGSPSSSWSRRSKTPPPILASTARTSSAIRSVL